MAGMIGPDKHSAKCLLMVTTFMLLERALVKIFNI